MSGYTPGPWIVEESDFDDSILITTADRSGAFVPVAAVSTGYTGPIEDEQQANLRLIAAAPDLLEALIDARNQLEVYEREATGETYNDLEINAAIRKATEAAS